MIDYTTRVARREIARAVLRNIGDRVVLVAALLVAAEAAGKSSWWVVAILVIASGLSFVGSLVADRVYTERA